MARLRPGTAWPEFERLVAIETDECVLWVGSCGDHGYGQIRWSAPEGARVLHVHSVACERRHGPPPFAKAHAAHSCRNRHCMNYRHLRWATPKENAEDMVRDGTSLRGERSRSAKLTETRVRALRGAWAEGIGAEDLAAEFGVSVRTVYNVANRESWGWLA